ncbi:MAG: hypothetical protein U5Q44_11565 [Dehalococcoidia bacterium]|nr:hypothetical protein [Dehalococcoidia bacterium]
MSGHGSARRSWAWTCETFIAAAVGVFASRIEFKGERMRDHLYEERLARIGPDIHQAVERWLHHAPTPRDGRTGDHRDL